MGPMSYNEKLVCAVMGGALVLWVGGESLGIAPAVTAMLGLR
jgi:DASS family divalent anion:Na+ symporter